MLNYFTNKNKTKNITKNKVYFEDVKWEDTIEFTFPIKEGNVVRVLTADTIHVAAKLPYDTSPLYRLSVRLNGIYAPEIRGLGISIEEKSSAIIARDYVANMVLNKWVRLENISIDKNSLIMADVYIGDIHLNEHLLKERYVVKSDGITKIKPKSWLKYRVIGEN